MAAPKQAFHLAGKTYDVKTQVEANVQHIVKHSDLDTPLTGLYFHFMRDLFAYHTRADLKIGPGIDAIVVRISSRNRRNREFWIRQNGGEEWIDISWRECLRTTTALAEFRNACRLAVKPVTRAFCDSTFAAQAEAGYVLCPLTGESVFRAAAHVDHDDPWPFSQIVDAFIEQMGIDVEAVEYDGFEHGSTFITLRDRTLAERFVTFHNSVARLRVVSRAGNLGRSRSTATSS